MDFFKSVYTDTHTFTQRYCTVCLFHSSNSPQHIECVQKIVLENVWQNAISQTRWFINVQNIHTKINKQWPTIHSKYTEHWNRDSFSNVFLSAPWTKQRQKNTQPLNLSLKVRLKEPQRLHTNLFFWFPFSVFPSMVFSFSLFILIN